MSSARRIAVFGDSYVVRLQKFCNGDLKVPSAVRFFGKGGKTAERPDPKLLQALRVFQPHLVVVILERNDVTATSSPRRIAGDVLHLRDEILDAGVKEVYLCGITECGTFPRSLDLTHKSFNAQRKKINEIFSESGSFLCMKKIRFPKHYLKDLVHLDEIGLKKLFFIIPVVMF